MLLSSFIGTVALIFFSATIVLGTPYTEQKEWNPHVGDRLVIDTKENVGYLIHPNGQYMQFLVITGQKRVVHYIGRTYNAATPERTWVMQSRHIKGDRITYGPTGRFLRLYYKDENTPYGIHEHAQEDFMFTQDSRFQSMGCIIVRSKILNIIEKTYNLNEGRLDVVTVYGVEEPQEVATVASLK